MALSNPIANESRPARPATDGRGRASSLERLPAELQQAIFARLDYQSLIRLSSCARHLRDTIDPQTAAWQDKVAFVMRAERDFPQNFPRYVQGQEHPGRFACYVCFRVRTAEYFERDQGHGGGACFDREGNKKVRADAMGRKLACLRRFCIECGVRDGMHGPGDLLRTRTEQELWVCACRRVWLKPDCLKCEVCKTNCPFTSRRA